jgi:hypothetical protein
VSVDAVSRRRDRWGPEGPPPEAYSRVTNPERFGPLHRFAERLLTNLEEEFDVSREEDLGLDPDLGRNEPTVRLTPRPPEAGTLTIAFTSFPGLLVRLGHWYEEPIPGCGCDACDETAEQGQARLEWIAGTLTSGRFRESIRPGLLSHGWLFHVLNNARPQRMGEVTNHAIAGSSHDRRAGGTRSFDNQPWPAGTPAGPTGS